MTYFLTWKAFSAIINICEHILLLWHKAVKYGVGRRKNVEKAIPHIRLCAYFLQFVFHPCHGICRQQCERGNKYVLCYTGRTYNRLFLTLKEPKRKATHSWKLTTLQTTSHIMTVLIYPSATTAQVIPPCLQTKDLHLWKRATLTTSLLKCITTSADIFLLQEAVKRPCLPISKEFGTRICGLHGAAATP